MKIIVRKNYEEVSIEAANIFEREIRENPNTVLGMATGSTPIGMYKELIRRHKEEGLDFSGVITFNLDEYLGLYEDNENSYRYFMDNEFFNHINILKENTHVPKSDIDVLDETCSQYDDMIFKAGGVRLQVLGVGSNGHIAFNEPAERLNAYTSVVDLTEETIKDNSRFFDSMDQVPKKAVSMGMGSILKSEKIVLIATGKNKAQAIAKLIKDPYISTHLPVSFLLAHRDVTIICDEDAYSLVE